MAQPTNTHSSYDSIGIKEDISDIITLITPMDTPITTAIGSGTVTQRDFQWQTRELPAIDDANAVIEADDPANDVATLTVMLKNSTQLSDKVIVVSSTMQATDAYGRTDELSDQMALQSIALKKDVEAIISRNQGRVAGNDTTARKTRSMESWLETNVSRGAGGADGTDTTAATDGTQRALTEDLFKTVIRDIYSAGGNADMMFVGPFNKQVVSSWNMSATKTVDASKETLFGSVDLLKTDFGAIKVIPNRVQRDRTALILEPDKWRLDFLQKYAVEPLAKTGHSTRKMLSVEYGLRSWNEKASGAVADLTTS